MFLRIVTAMFSILLLFILFIYSCSKSQTEKTISEKTGDLKEIEYMDVVRFKIPADWLEEYPEKGGAIFYDSNNSIELRLNIVTLLKKDERISHKKMIEELQNTKWGRDREIEILPNGNALLESTEISEKSGQDVQVIRWQLANHLPSKGFQIALFSCRIFEPNRETYFKELLRREIRNATFITRQIKIENQINMELVVGITFFVLIGLQIATLIPSRIFKSKIRWELFIPFVSLPVYMGYESYYLRPEVLSTVPIRIDLLILHPLIIAAFISWIYRSAILLIKQKNRQTNLFALAKPSALLIITIVCFIGWWSFVLVVCQFY